MTEIDDLRQEMAEEVLAVMGVTATYTFKDDSSQSLTVRYDRDVETFNKDGELVVAQHVVGISKADVPTPKMGESITIAGVTRKLGRELSESGGLKRFELT